LKINEDVNYFVEILTGRKKDVCNKPVLKNGKTKLRSGGRVVKYSCFPQFLLVGESTATCIRGEWTSDPPVCAGKCSHEATCPTPFEAAACCLSFPLCFPADILIRATFLAIASDASDPFHLS